MITMAAHYSPSELDRIYQDFRESAIRVFHRWIIALQDEGEEALAAKTSLLLNRYSQDPKVVTDSEIAALWIEIAEWFTTWLEDRDV